ncbi:MAG: HlyD family efflux transporter periplasmic adaptor subunit [Pirellulales bacterium]
MLQKSTLVAPRLEAMQMVESPRLVRRMGRWVVTLLVGAAAALLLLPWQQTSKGTGRVVAFNPTERPQTIESPIYGRIVRWEEGIREGARVRQGQPILEIRDIDPSRGERLEIQVFAVREKLMFAKTKVETYGRQVVDLDQARLLIIEAGQQLVEEARRKVEAERHAVEAAEAAVEQTQLNFERQKLLKDQGLTSGVTFEKERRSYEEAQAKLKAAKQYVQAAEKYLKSKEAELGQKSREGLTKVDYARAMQQEAQGEVALATKELSEIEGKQAQFESRVVTAPKDGVILRLMANENTEMLKEGDPLFTIVPEAPDRAVEMWVDGNDIPLITPGREVRLQFEGWPAVQFAAGWPSAAFGTFGGRIAAVDAADNGKGKFRIIIRPIEEEPWPEEALLRQGARTNGWVLLSQVSLGYEIWRQLNGFPPVFDGPEPLYGSGKDGKDGKGTDWQSDDASKSGGKEAKKVKLPK